MQMPEPDQTVIARRVQRTTKMLQSLEETPGDLEKAYTKLRAARDRETAGNAEQYLRGVYLKKGDQE
jgi:hypothetical protein